MNDEPQSRSWWTTLPGVLTAIAAVLTAATGLILALRGPHTTNSSTPPRQAASTPVTVQAPPLAPAPPPDRCRALDGNSLQISANKNQFHGTIGPIRLTQDAASGYRFQT